MLKDLRHGFRTLLQAKGWTAVVVLSLALGIGANAAPFVVVDGQAELASAFISSGNYYQLLGIGARLGRTIVPDDDRPTAPPVAVISSKYWHARFGTDPSVIGRAVKMNNVPVTIVGVLPP